MRILVCRPEFFDVAYVINPWMEGQIGRVDRARAQAQWQALICVLIPLAVKLTAPHIHRPVRSFSLIREEHRPTAPAPRADRHPPRQ